MGRVGETQNRAINTICAAGMHPPPAPWEERGAGTSRLPAAWACRAPSAAESLRIQRGPGGCLGVRWDCRCLIAILLCSPAFVSTGSLLERYGAAAFVA